MKKIPGGEISSFHIVQHFRKQFYDCGSDTIHPIDDWIHYQYRYVVSKSFCTFWMLKMSQCGSEDRRKA